jgi:hypothetical protein
MTLTLHFWQKFQTDIKTIKEFKADFELLENYLPKNLEAKN